MWSIAPQQSRIGENKIGKANGVLTFTSQNASDPNEGKFILKSDCCQLRR